MKLGLGESYDTVSILNPRTRAYLDITKPASTLGVAGGFTIALVFYYIYTGEVRTVGDKFLTIVWASIAVGLSHGASQAMNMAEDAEIDNETPHKQNRPIPSGIITEEEARTVSWISLLLSLAISYNISKQFGAVLTILAFFGIFYNLDPIRAKQRVISVPWQAISRGLMMFPAVWAVEGDIINTTPWVLGIFLFWYVLGFQNSADIIDRGVDEEYGIKTFVVMFGVTGVSIIATLSTVMMGLTINIGVQTGIVPSRFYWMLLILPLCMMMVFYLSLKPHSVSERTGNHPTWLMFYGGMVLSVIIPTAVELYIST